MKKDVAKHLNDLASELPLVFEMKMGKVPMMGRELNLTPLADKQRFEKDKLYNVPVPEYHAVEHHQQVKDAYKRGGMGAVKVYVRGVMNDFATGEAITMQIPEA